MKALIVFEIVPESTDLYIMEDPTTEEEANLREAAGKYINEDEDTAAVEWVSEALDAGRATKVDGHTAENIDLVVVCGFYL